MRLFIAIEIPDEIKRQMAEVQRRLKSAAVDASWPRPEGIHLTLKFLGEVPESLIPGIGAALGAALKDMGRFRLEVGGTGAFPNAKSARVIWIGVSGDVERLRRLRAAVEDAMAGLGIGRENQPFSPHLTLARLKYVRSKESLREALEREKDVRLPGFEANAVSLMKSELKRSGAEYTEITRVELR